MRDKLEKICAREIIVIESVFDSQEYPITARTVIEEYWYQCLPYFSLAYRRVAAITIPIEFQKISGVSESKIPYNNHIAKPITDKIVKSRLISLALLSRKIRIICGT